MREILFYVLKRLFYLLLLRIWNLIFSVVNEAKSKPYYILEVVQPKNTNIR